MMSHSWLTFLIMHKFLYSKIVSTSIASLYSFNYLKFKILLITICAVSAKLLVRVEHQQDTSGPTEFWLFTIVVNIKICTFIECFYCIRLDVGVWCFLGIIVAFTPMNWSLSMKRKHQGMYNCSQSQRGSKS